MSTTTMWAVIKSMKDKGATNSEILSEFAKAFDESNVREPEPKVTEQSVDLEVEVSDILRDLGVPAHIKGYAYVRHAIVISVKEPKMLESVTKTLYPNVAREFGTTSSRVERAIRHAIEVAWDRGNVDVLADYFGYTIHSSRGKPTNSEFIAMLTDRIRLVRKYSV